MNIFLKIFRIALTASIDVIVLGGIAIVLAWVIWDISPQTSISKTAYFFSESWHIITGKPRASQPEQVTSEQLKPSAKHIKYLYKE